MRTVPFFALPLVCVLAACAVHPAGDTPAPTASPDPALSIDESVARTPSVSGGEVGVLVMAHGGTEEWNAAVEEAVHALREDVPTAVAYGMANPRTLSAALDSLDAAGARRVAVVRMFLSGESFLDQTRYYLGMSETPPEMFVLMGPAAADPTARRQLEHRLSIATHAYGMLTSTEAATIMAERALELSVAPRDESVLLVAHGMGDEHENSRVLDAMEAIANRIRADGFERVQSATLREDWEDARRVAEAEIRDYVSGESESGRRVLVLPMRLSGFGPYAEVLDGLTYVPGRGLLPHEEIATWVRSTANVVTCGAGWGPIGTGCPTAITVDDVLLPSLEEK